MGFSSIFRFHEITCLWINHKIWMNFSSINQLKKKNLDKNNCIVIGTLLQPITTTTTKKPIDRYKLRDDIWVGKCLKTIPIKIKYINSNAIPIIDEEKLDSKWQTCMMSKWKRTIYDIHDLFPRYAFICVHLQKSFHIENVSSHRSLFMRTCPIYHW